MFELIVLKADPLGYERIIYFEWYFAIPSIMQVRSFWFAHFALPALHLPWLGSASAEPGHTVLGTRIVPCAVAPQLAPGHPPCHPTVCWDRAELCCSQLAPFPCWATLWGPRHSDQCPIAGTGQCQCCTGTAQRHTHPGDSQPCPCPTVPWCPMQPGGLYQGWAITCVATAWPGHSEQAGHQPTLAAPTPRWHCHQPMPALPTPQPPPHTGLSQPTAISACLCSRPLVPLAPGGGWGMRGAGRWTGLMDCGPINFRGPSLQVRQSQGNLHY